MSNDNRIVFDLETKKEFAEVGGYRNVHLLGISVAGVFSYADDQYRAFEEREIDQLEEMISNASLLIGFNNKHFDNQVLQPYFKNVDLSKIPTVDLMEKIEGVVGFRLGLDALARVTLGEQKTSHGLEALKWFREGKIEEIKKYCLQDVKLTKELYEYGLNHGSVLFESRNEGVKAVPARWAESKNGKDIKTILSLALKNKEVVEIDYVSTKSEDGEDARKKRNIEIYHIKGDTIEAFCHLRQDKRNFKIFRILDANVVGTEHKRPTLF